MTIYPEQIAEELAEADQALHNACEKLATALGYATTMPERDEGMDHCDPERLQPLLTEADRLHTEVCDLVYDRPKSEPESEDQGPAHPDAARLRALADDLDRYHTPDGRHADMVRAVGVELVSLGNDIRNERH